MEAIFYLSDFSRSTTKVQRECFYVDVDGHGTNDNFNLGIEWILKNSGTTTSGLIATISLQNILACSEYPGMKALKTLVKAPHIATINGIKLQLITESNIPFNGVDRPLLVIHPTKKFLDKLFQIANIPKMLVIPWSMNEIEGWKQYSNAIKLGTSNKPNLKYNFSKVVYLALQHLSECLNRDYSLAKPNNKEATVNILKILQKNKEYYSADEVKICLISEFGVPAQLAEQISEVARNIKNGRKYRTQIQYRNEIISHWREKAREIA